MISMPPIGYCLLLLSIFEISIQRLVMLCSRNKKRWGVPWCVINKKQNTFLLATSLRLLMWWLEIDFLIDDDWRLLSCSMWKRDRVSRDPMDNGRLTDVIQSVHSLSWVSLSNRFSQKNNDLSHNYFPITDNPTHPWMIICPRLVNSHHTCFS